MGDGSLVAQKTTALAARRRRTMGPWLSAGSFLIIGSGAAADLPVSSAAPAPPTPTSCFTDAWTFFNSSAKDCPLSKWGITVYGHVDVGYGHSTHGAGFNRNYPQGVQEVIAKFSQSAQSQWTPNGLGRSDLGVKGLFSLGGGWSLQFNADTDFDPLSFQLANGPASLVDNNAKPIGLQSANGDSSRAGQWDNTVGYVGLKNDVYGSLYLGRVNSLTADAVGKYDAMGGSYAFSLIGNSATLVSGLGDTETTRYNTAVRYEGAYGPLRASAVWQFGGYSQGNGSNGALQASLGADWRGFSIDGIVGGAKDAVSLSNYAVNPLPAAVTPNDLKATLADIRGGVIAAKYVYGPLTGYGGYEYVRFAAPTDPYPQGFGSLGGTSVLPGAVNATAYSVNRSLQVGWVGVKYALRSDVDVATAYYLANQNDYSPLGSPSSYCAPNAAAPIPGGTPHGAAHSTCAGTLQGV